MEIITLGGGVPLGSFKKNEPCKYPASSAINCKFLTYATARLVEPTNLVPDSTYPL